MRSFVFESFDVDLLGNDLRADVIVFGQAETHLFQKEFYFFPSIHGSVGFNLGETTVVQCAWTSTPEDLPGVLEESLPLLSSCLDFRRYPIVSLLAEPVHSPRKSIEGRKGSFLSTVAFASPYSACCHSAKRFNQLHLRVEIRCFLYQFVRLLNHFRDGLFQLTSTLRQGHDVLIHLFPLFRKVTLFDNSGKDTSSGDRVRCLKGEDRHEGNSMCHSGRTVRVCFSSGNNRSSTSLNLVVS